MVTRRRSVTLKVSERTLAVTSGDAATIAYRITNDGNAPDTVSLAVVPPPGWRGGATRPVILAAGASDSTSARIVTPPTGFSGLAVVRLAATSRADTLAHANATIEVDRDGGTGAGAALTLGVSTARTPNGLAGTAYALRMQGPLADGVSINATMAKTVSASPSALGLSRSAYYPMPPSVTLQSAAWRLGLGLTSVTLPDLAGSWVTGNGASLEVTHPRWSARVLAARPYVPAFTFGAARRDLGRGEFAAVSAQGEAGIVSAGATYAHLLDNQFQLRQLDAVDGNVALSLPSGVRFTSEAAARRYAGGSGLGWRTELRRDGMDGSFDLSVGRTPGGANAFARSGDELRASASRSFGRVLSFSGNFWRMRDSSAGWTSLESSGLSVGPSVRLGRSAQLSLDLDRFNSTAAGTVGSLKNGESTVRGSLSVRVAGISAAVRASAGTIQRGIGFAGAPSTGRNASHTQVDADVNVGGALGQLSLTGSVQRNGLGSGLPTESRAFGARVSDVPLVPGSDAVLAHATVERSMWSGAQSLPPTVRIGADIRLPLGFTLVLDAERNPFFSSLPGATGWTTGMRLERTGWLPRLDLGGDHAVVYHDLNGNGKRDRGEPGVAGVILRSGSLSAVTNADGVARLAGGTAWDMASVDVRSIPVGLVAPPQRAGAAALPISIGLITVVTVDVHFIPAPGSDGRIATSDFERITAFAVDTAGHSWAARPRDRGWQSFDALPPGHYRVQLDLSGASQPLFASSALPEFDVVSGTPSHAVVIPLRTRELRLRVFTGAVIAANTAPPGGAPAVPATGGRAGPAAAKLASHAASRTIAEATPGRFVVQVAAYGERAGAERLVRKLGPVAGGARIAGQQRPYRVLIGEYATWSAAVQEQKELERHGITGFVRESLP